MATASKKSQEAQVQEIERMKDGQMPVLMIEVAIKFEAQERVDEITIRVVNRGSGPAFIKHITTRREINGGSLYYCALRHAMIGVGETVDETVRVDQQHPIRDDVEGVSSISLWYVDVYGRWYRSRVIFKYPRKLYTQESGVIQVLFREHFPHVAAPSFVYDYVAAVNNVHDAEFGRVVPFDSEVFPLSKLESIARVTEKEYPGSALTHGRPIRILDYSFWLNAYPLFRVQIGPHPAWFIGMQVENGSGKRKVFWGREDLLQSRLSVIMENDAQLSEPEKYGLKDTQSIAVMGLALYEELLTEALKRAQG